MPTLTQDEYRAECDRIACEIGATMARIDAGRAALEARRAGYGVLAERQLDALTGDDEQLKIWQTFALLSEGLAIECDLHQITRDELAVANLNANLQALTVNRLIAIAGA